MRLPPEYPSYKTATPPQTGRWLSAGALLVLVSGGIAALSSAPGDKTSSVAVALVVVTGLAALLWMIRLLSYRVGVHNACFYHQLVDYEQQQWWYQHRQSFALPRVVLLGPAGSTPADGQQMLDDKLLHPADIIKADGNVMHLGLIIVSDVASREIHLVQLLVKQWRDQQGDTPVSSPLYCYWQGTDETWQAFIAQMSIIFADVVLPARPEPWHGEASLSAIASALAAAPSGSTILVAGCESVPAVKAAHLPAGESAVLWLAGLDGPVKLTRGEVFSAEKGEELPAVCLRAQEQSELDNPPDSCLLFSQPQLASLAQSGWDVTHHLQDANWGDSGRMEALIVISLAAINAANHKKPCGWIARDPAHTLALGIVKPDGKNH